MEESGVVSTFLKETLCLEEIEYTPATHPAFWKLFREHDGLVPALSDGHTMLVSRRVKSQFAGLLRNRLPPLPGCVRRPGLKIRQMFASVRVLHPLLVPGLCSG